MTSQPPRPTTLHGYFRSAASWRVRIALNLKNIPIEHHPLALREGEHRQAAYRALNPQGLVPALELDDGSVVIQSLAIIEYLDETWPEPKLLPAEPRRRAAIRGFALALAADTHPLQNLGVLNRLRDHGLSGDQVQQWAAAINASGLDACAALIDAEPGPFCFGEAPSLADLCLVPQLGNARRFGVDVTRFPRLLRAEAACMELAAFAAAVPGRQVDAH